MGNAGYRCTRKQLPCDCLEMANFFFDLDVVHVAAQVFLVATFGYAQ
jgi:hypothetical protein